MSWRVFIVSLVRALAWPVLIAGVLLMFRGALAKFLTNAKSLKVGYGKAFAKVQLNTRRAEAKAEESAAGSGQVARLTATLETRSDLAARLVGYTPIQLPPGPMHPAAKMGYVFDLLTIRVRDVLAAHGVQVADVAEWNRLALLAHQQGLITTDTAVALQGLEVVNDLSASRADEVTEDEADEYLRMANGTLFAVAQNLQVPPADNGDES